MTHFTRKLHLRTQTLKPLTNDALRRVGGGFIMKDTIIIRTSTRIEEGPTDACAETIDGRP
jgi:hypothetical protein